MIRLLSLVVFLFLLSCGSSADMTGSGTGVGNGITLSGVIHDSTDHPIEGIELELVPNTYLPPNYDARLGESIYTQTSGFGGCFTFTDVTAGSYNLWAIASDDAMGLLNLELDDDFSQVTLDEFKIKELIPHFIKVRGVSSGTGDVRVYGSTLVKPFTIGEVVTLRLPQGENRCRIDVLGYTTLSGDTISLIANDTVEVYLLEKDTDSYCYATDSLIVHHILHLNGLDYLTVKEVTNTSDDDDDDDEEVKRVKSISFSGASVLPEIVGKLKPLETLELTDGTLKVIPETVGELSSLERLDVTNNALQTLPRGLMFLENLDSVYVEGNPMDSLTGDMKLWLDELDDDD